jgi:hypothetical protein
MYTVLGQKGILGRQRLHGFSEVLVEAPFQQTSVDQPTAAMKGKDKRKSHQVPDAHPHESHIFCSLPPPSSLPSHTFRALLLTVLSDSLDHQCLSWSGVGESSRENKMTNTTSRSDSFEAFAQCQVQDWTWLGLSWLIMTFLQCGFCNRSHCIAGEMRLSTAKWLVQRDAADQGRSRCQI